jgi:hypothetical protein
MDSKPEGLVFPPVPLVPIKVKAKEGTGAPRCEMCGAEVVASHCKRICLRCGFMTGCSEGV